MDSHFIKKQIRELDWSFDTSSNYYKTELELPTTKDILLNVYKEDSDTNTPVITNINYLYTTINNKRVLTLYSVFKFSGLAEIFTDPGEHIKYITINTTDWKLDADDNMYRYRFHKKGSFIIAIEGVDNATSVGEQEVKTIYNHNLDIDVTPTNNITIKSISPLKCKLVYFQ